MGEWKTKVSDTVEIGQNSGPFSRAKRLFPISSKMLQRIRRWEEKPVEAAVPAAELDDRGRPARHYRIEPALSPTITRKLSRVIPANLQIDARWDAIRKLRDAAKKKNGGDAPSPSVMIAWAVVRAMENHAPFRRLTLEDDRIVENEDFDLGMAVALEGDRLATAVITG
jgi:2-oxoisovalerate dehydrogenase E1 component